MRRLFLMALFSTCAVSARAQLDVPGTSLTGHFFVSVDDRATLYLNGQQIYKAPFGESQSDELNLKVGDHLVVHLEDDGGGRHFLLLFASKDEKSVVSFRRINFRIVHDPGLTDFTSDDFDQNDRKATLENFTSPFTIQNSSEPIWGDLSKCTLICLITQDMFR